MHKGKLTIWKDDRGFGFIQLDDTEKKVFLHISSLRNKRALAPLLWRKLKLLKLMPTNLN